MSRGMLANQWGKLSFTLLIVMVFRLATDTSIAHALPSNQEVMPINRSSEPVSQHNHDRPSDLPGDAPVEPIDLPADVIDQSPVLQRWLNEVPDVRAEIHNDPSFRTRLRLGYSHFPSSEHQAGFNVGIEDVFLGRTGLAASADYHSTFEDDRQSYGADLRYYVLPLGSYVNVAPIVGYRRLETDNYNTDGVNLGLRLQLVPSRTGAADLAVSQTWVNPGSSSEEVGITTLSVGYAVTDNLRVSTDLQRQNAPQDDDSRLGVSLEWML